VQTTRITASFDTLTMSVTRTAAEIFPRKAMCDSAVFLQTAWINPDITVLKTYSSITLIQTQRVMLLLPMQTITGTDISIGENDDGNGLVHPIKSSSGKDTWGRLPEHGEAVQWTCIVEIECAKKGKLNCWWH